MVQQLLLTLPLAYLLNFAPRIAALPTPTISIVPTVAAAEWTSLPPTFRLPGLLRNPNVQATPVLNPKSMVASALSEYAVILPEEMEARGEVDGRAYHEKRWTTDEASIIIAAGITPFSRQRGVTTAFTASATSFPITAPPTTTVLGTPEQTNGLPGPLSTPTVGPTPAPDLTSLAASAKPKTKKKKKKVTKKKATTKTKTKKVATPTPKPKPTTHTKHHHTTTSSPTPTPKSISTHAHSPILPSPVGHTTSSHHPKSSTKTSATPKSSSGSISPLPAPGTTSPLPNTLTSWSLTSPITSLSAFMADLGFSRYAWGNIDATIVAQIPASAWEGGVVGSGGVEKSALRAFYPANSVNPGTLPQGGFGFYASPIAVDAAHNVSLSYSVFFPVGFNFVKGGKLPGLYGGKQGCSGGQAAENCFSTRMMFRTGGMGELYLYAPREKQVPKLCTIKPLSFCNSVYGMTIGRGSWTFKTGVWTNIRQDIWLNTPGYPDGGFNIWVNNKLVLHSTSVYYRNLDAAGKIGNGTFIPPIPLINYDDLPSNITIPNGGLIPDASDTVPTSVSSFSLSGLVTKIVPTSTGIGGVGNPKAPVTTFATNYRNRDKRTIESNDGHSPTSPAGFPTPTSLSHTATLTCDPLLTSSCDKEIKKRTVAPELPIGYLGIMFDTFFGGSSPDYKTPTNQESWFQGLRLGVVS